MQLSEYRTIWTSLGGALFATGFVIGADWIFAVSGAPPSRHLSYNSAALYISIFLTVLGMIVFIIALTDLMGLPGRARIRADELKREEVLILLAKFLGRGSIHMLMRETTAQNYANWTSNLIEFIRAAFGAHEAALLIPGPSANTAETFATVCNGIQSLIIRGRQIPISREFDPFASPDPVWKVYLSSVAQDIERFANSDESGTR
jgi:hypothetical protein